jgi:hypothetical protein
LSGNRGRFAIWDESRKKTMVGAADSFMLDGFRFRPQAVLDVALIDGEIASISRGDGERVLAYIVPPRHVRRDVRGRAAGTPPRVGRRTETTNQRAIMSRSKTRDNEGVVPSLADLKGRSNLDETIVGDDPDIDIDTDRESAECTEPTPATVFTPPGGPRPAFRLQRG